MVSDPVEVEAFSFSKEGKQDILTITARDGAVTRWKLDFHHVCELVTLCTEVISPGTQGDYVKHEEGAILPNLRGAA
jgi:hypothetical protein